MKCLRIAVIVLVALSVAVCLYGISSANEAGHQKCHKDMEEKFQAKIKALKDSAAALQKSNPDLAKGLTDLAAEKENKVQDMMSMKAKHEAKTKMLRDSAAALQKTNPELAEELWDMSEYSHMKKMCGEKMGCPMGMKCRQGD